MLKLLLNLVKPAIGFNKLSPRIQQKIKPFYTSIHSQLSFLANQKYQAPVNKLTISADYNTGHLDFRKIISKIDLQIAEIDIRKQERYNRFREGLLNDLRLENEDNLLKKELHQAKMVLSIFNGECFDYEMEVNESGFLIQKIIFNDLPF
ncbi:hypothetical protein VB776_16205 [Arcicella sp. DC2W]|uniref:Uncharacterized protein n=1 Tax=Arcicella gelida TaxID=2984195 RepID=A0ABU5S7M1_9BACT|nr:hypothetical protein [Arcicella sp. DC2W]MEA5404476.1 hypothetical protein [Arcicella sp. DC2W]